MHPDTETQALLDWVAAANLPPLTAYTPAEARRQFRLRSEKADIPPPAVNVCKDIRIPGPGGEVPLRLYGPPAGGDVLLPVLVFFFTGVVLCWETWIVMTRFAARSASVRNVWWSQWIIAWPRASLPRRGRGCNGGCILGHE